MSAEINETSKVQSTSPVEAVQGEISSTNIEPQPRISEDIKKLLNSLLQKIAIIGKKYGRNFKEKSYKKKGRNT